MAGDDRAGGDRAGGDRAGTGAGEPWDSRYAAFTERGRSALLNGDQTYDRPLGETGRWGASVVFRPRGQILRGLAAFVDEVATVLAGGLASGPGSRSRPSGRPDPDPGLTTEPDDTTEPADTVRGPSLPHWVHGPECWHTTLRALELHRADIPPGDERISAYAAALDEAVAGLPPFDVEVRGLSPHQGGLLLFVRPVGKTLLELQARLDEALHARDACASEKEHARDIWNIGLVHFTGPLKDPAGFVAWCDARRDLDLGTTTFDAVDIVRAHPAPHDVRLETLHRAALLGHVRP